MYSCAPPTTGTLQLHPLSSRPNIPIQPSPPSQHVHVLMYMYSYPASMCQASSVHVHVHAPSQHVHAPGLVLDDAGGEQHGEVHVQRDVGVPHDGGQVEDLRERREQHAKAVGAPSAAVLIGRGAAVDDVHEGRDEVRDAEPVHDAQRSAAVGRDQVVGHQYEERSQHRQARGRDVHSLQGLSKVRPTRMSSRPRLG